MPCAFIADPCLSPPVAPHPGTRGHHHCRWLPETWQRRDIFTIHPTHRRGIFSGVCISRHMASAMHCLPGRCARHCQLAFVGLSKACERPRGGVVTQRTANPFTPVRFRARPPYPLLISVWATTWMPGTKPGHDGKRSVRFRARPLFLSISVIGQRHGCPAQRPGMTERKRSSIPGEASKSFQWFTTTIPSPVPSGLQPGLQSPCTWNPVPATSRTA